MTLSLRVMDDAEVVLHMADSLKPVPNYRIQSFRDALPLARWRRDTDLTSPYLIFYAYIM